MYKLNLLAEWDSGWNLKGGEKTEAAAAAADTFHLNLVGDGGLHLRVLLESEAKKLQGALML